MLWLVLLYFAQAEEVFLRIAINDSEEKRLKRPTLSIAEREFALFDDGSLAGDVKSDHIWVTTIFIEKKETVSLILRAEGIAPEEISFSLPNQSTHTLQLRAGSGKLSLDEKAPDMPWKDDGRLTLNSTVVGGVQPGKEGR